ncbi:MAG: AAA family ATPase, partial [Roseovarius sp.]|nr:AAA family ATPase [Roseovarius sp.]
MPEPDHPAALPPEALRAPVSTADFDFDTTETLEPLGAWLGQDRGIGVMRMAAAMGQGDFNAFVMGNPGSGRHRIARAILADAARRRPCPGDWVYVNNFDAPHKPVAIALPPGDAERFRKAMEEMIDDLAVDIPALFESDDDQARRRAIEEGFSSAHEEAMSAVFEEARARKV